MPTIADIFAEMPNRYVPGRNRETKIYYFSVGDLRYTVRLSPDACEVREGKGTEPADYVLKTTPDLFEKMVIKGKLPGPLDIARGKVKTNDPLALKRMREFFDFTGV